MSVLMNLEIPLKKEIIEGFIDYLRNIFQKKDV